MSFFNYDQNSSFLTADPETFGFYSGFIMGGMDLGIPDLDFTATGPVSRAVFENNPAIPTHPEVKGHNATPAPAIDGVAMEINPVFSALTEIETYGMDPAPATDEGETLANPHPSPTRFFSSAGEWERHRDFIVDLWQTQNKTLKEVQELVKSRLGLTGTNKMYKSKFKKWGLEKNNRRADVEAIVRTKAQRDAIGKASQFLLRDRPVRLGSIERYMKRNKISLQSLCKPETALAASLKDLVCRPPPRMASPMLHLECHKKTEKFLHNVVLLTHAHYDEIDKRWNGDQKGFLDSFTRSRNSSTTGLNAFARGLVEFKGGWINAAGLHWRIAFADIYNALRDSYPILIFDIIGTIGGAISFCQIPEECSELKIMLKKHIRQIAETIYPFHHPARLLYHALADFTDDDLKELVYRSCKLHGSSTSARFKKSCKLTWTVDRHLIELLSAMKDHTCLTEYQSLISDMEDQSGRLDRNVCSTILNYCFSLARFNHLNEAMQELHGLLVRLSELGEDKAEHGWEFQHQYLIEFQCLYQIGQLQYVLGELDAARENFMKALVIFQQYELDFNQFNDILYFMYDFLVNIALEISREIEAEEWRSEIAKLNGILRSKVEEADQETQNLRV